MLPKRRQAEKLDVNKRFVEITRQIKLLIKGKILYNMFKTNVKTIAT